MRLKFLGKRKLDLNLIRFYRSLGINSTKSDAFNPTRGTNLGDKCHYSPITRSTNANKMLSNPRGMRVAPKTSHCTPITHR